MSVGAKHILMCLKKELAWPTGLLYYKFLWCMALLGNNMEAVTYSYKIVAQTNVYIPFQQYEPRVDSWQHA